MEDDVEHRASDYVFPFFFRWQTKHFECRQDDEYCYSCEQDPECCHGDWSDVYEQVFEEWQIESPDEHCGGEKCVDFPHGAIPSFGMVI